MGVGVNVISSSGGSEAQPPSQSDKTPATITNRTLRIAYPQ
ncbi:hypothetical protein SPLC1_S532530 [Arthrospira platensis C1]|nr:hypothetical protein SPLC1_S532530 [Arthrospira platensis C1]